MQTQPEPIPPAETLPLATEKKLLAPLWHTAALIVLLLTYSYFGSGAISAPSHAVPQKFLIVQYAVTMVFEGFLLFWVWLGLRMKGTRLRELIGGRWNSPEDFLIELGIAIGFWMAAMGVLIGLGYALGLTNPSQQKQAKQLADLIAPQGTITIVLWILLSAIAGFVEEIVFRGYLQRQLSIITGSVAAGLLLSAVLFGGGHGYEGARRMVLIAVYGVLFGLLALWRKSLRPGMIAHAWHDAFTGILLRVISQMGGVPSK